MDIDIVNTVLRLCFEQQTCLFEVPILCDYCLEQRLCTNSKHVLASIKNYMEIFKISRDRNRIEFFMPFEICRNNFLDGLCQNNGDLCPNLHVCYDYFYANSCRRSINCPYPHMLTQRYHENILGTLINLDLEALTKAFRVYCQSKKHLLGYNSSGISSSRGQQPMQSSSSSSVVNNSTLSSSSSSSSTNNWRLTVTPQISGHTSWKTNNRTTQIPRTIPIQPQLQQQSPQTITQTFDKGLLICWTPQKDIQPHFIEVVFSNQGKSNGGPIRNHQIYQHLGIAKIFYQNSDIVDRVIQHGSVSFQSFTFTSRLLQRTIDMRHICFSNLPSETNHIPSYIDTISLPYTKSHFEYYQNDKQTILVQYNEDIDFDKICSNIRNHSDFNGLTIKCIQLYYPETLLIEYDKEYSENEIEKLFENQRIFHIKTYSCCSFVHFYSHDDLLNCMKRSFDNPIKLTPIYIDIYTPDHLEKYLQQRQLEIRSKSLTNGSIKKETIVSTDKIDLSQKSVPSTNTDLNCLFSKDKTSVKEIHPEPKLPIKEEISPPIIPPSSEPIPELKTELSVETNGTNNYEDNDDDDDDEDEDENIEDEILVSDDDFNDLPSDFDNDDLFLDEFVDNNGDMEFLRSAAKNLMSSLAEMEAASANMNTMDAPHSLLYGDDYVVTIKSRRFALAFLDYTQFRVEKQRNPDKFRLLASLKKNAINNSNRKKQRDDTPSSIESNLLTTIETKSKNKKRNKRNKKKKNLNKEKSEPTPESINDEDDEDDNTIHVFNDQEYNKSDFPIQRLPHVYLDNDLKPCIVVAGEEHNEENEQETGEHEDWHNIIAGGKLVPVSKKSKKKKQHQQQKEEKLKQNSIEQNPTTPVPTNISPPTTEQNILIIPSDCRGFIHNPKLFETFRLSLRRSFSSINIRFQPDTYSISIDGNNKLNVQQCLNYLNSLPSYKRSLTISYENFPQTTITNIIRMQQSTAQIKLDQHANYNRLFRSTYRLIDYQLKQQYNQQQCIYCRRSKKQFRITYLEFPSDKQTNQELKDLIQQRVLQLLTTRFTYIPIALSADLMTTKRWAEFYKNLSNHKEINKTLLINKLNTIIQIYGLHANVQQIQTLITKFLDINRYEKDVIETEQASGLYSLFKNDFQEMEKRDIFREAELRFIYRHHRRILLVQCFQEKFELVKSQIQKLRSQLSSIVLPVKSSILSRYYSKSNELQRIAAASSCIITIEQRVDPNRDSLINLKIIGRSLQNIDRAQKIIKDFEEQKYSTKKIHNKDIHSFTEQEIKSLEAECNTCNVSCKIDQPNNTIELEGLLGDFIQIETSIHNLSLIAARRALDHIHYSTQWVYYDHSTNKPVAFGETIKRQLETCYSNKQKGLVNFRDHTGQIRTFDLDKMLEIKHGNNPSISPIFLKIERRDFKNPQSVQLPSNWTPMTKSWDRILLGKRDNPNEWKANNEIQKLLKLPYMLPEPWIIEIYRVQNPRMFQQYMAHKENFAARSQDIERTLYRLAQLNLIDDMCAHGFNKSHTDSAFSAYGHGCHFYCKAIDIDRTATLLAQNLQPTSIMLQQQTPFKPPVRFLFVCKVLVGRYTRGDASMKTCPPGYDSLVDNILSPEVFVTHQDAQVLPEYLICYQSAIF